jgi:hypothetical protein
LQHITDALSVDEFEQAMLAPAMAQLSLVRPKRQRTGESRGSTGPLLPHPDLDSLFCLISR